MKGVADVALYLTLVPSTAGEKRAGELRLSPGRLRADSLERNKHNIDRPGDNWLDNLDVIIAGDASLPEEDKDLLHVATRLASALAPLRAMAHRVASDYQRKHPYMRAEHRWVRRLTRIVLSRAWLLVASLALLVCITSISSVIGTATLWNRAVQALHTSTSLDQINGISIASLARPHAGLRDSRKLNYPRDGIAEI